VSGTAPTVAEQEHWRRQLVLTLVVVAVGIVSLRLMALSVARESDVYQVVMADGRRVRSASYLATLWPAALGLTAAFAVFPSLVVHVYRVARFTFRAGAQPSLRGELQ